MGTIMEVAFGFMSFAESLLSYRSLDSLWFLSFMYFLVVFYVLPTFGLKVHSLVSRSSSSILAFYLESRLFSLRICAVSYR